MNPVDVAYWPLVLIVPLYLLLCFPGSQPLGKACARILFNGPLGRGGIWTVWATCFIFCVICIKSAIDQPFRTDYREGALILTLNLLLILGTQSLYLLVDERDKVVKDRDVMKKQAEQVAQFSKNLLSEGASPVPKKAQETKMPSEEKRKEEEEDNEPRKRK